MILILVRYQLKVTSNQNYGICRECAEQTKSTDFSKTKHGPSEGVDLRVLDGDTASTGSKANLDRLERLIVVVVEPKRHKGRCAGQI